jgi:GT2 family glycosyltransferase
VVIGTIVPNNYFAPWEYVKSLANLKYEFVSFEGPSIPHNRNKIVEYIYETDEDLLFIDSDVVFSERDVAKVEDHLKDLDAVTGIYHIEYSPYGASIFERIEGDYDFMKPEEGVNKIGACGAGFLGISNKVIKALGTEPFSILKEGEVEHGEDISFCHRLREAGFSLWCDSSIKLGHLRTVPTFYNHGD